MSQSKLSKFSLGYEKLEEEPQLMRGVMQRLRRKREAKLKKKVNRAKNTKQNKR